MFAVTVNRYQDLARDWPGKPQFVRYAEYLPLDPVLSKLAGGPEARATQTLNQALGFVDDLVEAPLGDPSLQHDLAVALNHLRLWSYKFKDYGCAEKLLRQATALNEQLAEDFPNEVAYRDDLAGDYYDLGKCLVLVRRGMKPSRFSKVNRCTRTIDG